MAASSTVFDAPEGSGKAFRDATIREVQRMRPVISFAGRHTMLPFEVGGYRIPKGRLIGLSAGLTHYDPNLFERPDVFNRMCLDFLART